MQVVRIIKKFSGILSKHQKVRIVELGILMVLGGFLEMLSVSLILPFMNVVMNPETTMQKWYARIFCDMFHLQSSQAFLIALSVVLAILYILKNVYLVAEYDVQYRFVYRNMFALQSRLLESLLHRPYEDYLNVNSGEIIRIVQGDTPEAFSLLSTLLNLFTELTVTIILGIYVLITSPVITLCITAVLLVLVLVINFVLKPVLHKVGMEVRASNAGMYKWLLQSIQGIKEVKVMQREDYFRSNFDRYGQKNVESTRKNVTLNMIPRYIIEAIAMSTMFLVVAMMIYNGQSLKVMIPMLTVVAMAALRILPSINRISNALTAISYAEPMVDKLIENLKIFEENKTNEAASAQDKSVTVRQTVPDLKKQIEFHNISYHYPDTKEYVLNDASMIIHSGESVGIVGASGAGKTTAVDIALGLLCPQNGSVLVDGVDIKYGISGWLSQVGYIPQTIFLLDDSIKANIAFGQEGENLNENVWKALEEASLADFVRSLPDGIDTQIGERGIRLSGGQRQRIGIARALYLNPTVLIFDEATSALDNDTEKDIMESIYTLQGKKTMIIIAHRLTTIEACDHLFRVKDGKIEQER